MSKTNQPNAATQAAPAVKTVPAEVSTVKVVTSKPVASKVIVKKATTTKPAPAPSTAKSSPAKAAPKKVVVAKVAKPAKEKMPKLKMERDSFTMPKVEYAQFQVLKERLAKLGQPAKKSELLRAGIMQLTAMTDSALKAVMSKVPTIKTGRPKKK
jgi:hypothetical protein